MRACSEPVRGDEEQRDDVHVVTEVVEAPDRDERVLEVRDQPNPLVVDAHVEPVGPVVRLLLVREGPEHRDVHGHEGHECCDGPGAGKPQERDIEGLVRRVTPHPPELVRNLTDGPQHGSLRRGERAIETFHHLSGCLRPMDLGRGCDGLGRIRRVARLSRLGIGPDGHHGRPVRGAVATMKQDPTKAEGRTNVQANRASDDKRTY